MGRAASRAAGLRGRSSRSSSGVTGGLQTISHRDLVVTSEVYVDGPNGRFSTATDTWTILDFLGSTSFDWTTGVRVDSRTRANLACSNASYSASIVRVALYHPTSPGPMLKEYQLTLLPWSWQQIPVDVAVDGGTLLWRPYGGEAFCYAVNVDNVSNDGTFLGRATFVP